MRCNHERGFPATGRIEASHRLHRVKSWSVGARANRHCRGLWKYRPKTMNRTHYIFVDFENIHEVDLDPIADKPVVVILVLGERNKNLPVGLVGQLLKYSAKVRLVETGHAGKNALDFVLAYRIGLQAAADANGCFHILSRDKGFDALILHLKDNGISAARHEAFGKIAVLQNEKEQSPLDERVRVLTAHFARHQSNRPKKEKTLRSHVHAHFGKKLSDAELNATIEALMDRKIIGITAAGAVTYTN